MEKRSQQVISSKTITTVAYENRAGVYILEEDCHALQDTLIRYLIELGKESLEDSPDIDRIIVLKDDTRSLQRILEAKDTDKEIE